jgi:hypothetical protein
MPHRLPDFFAHGRAVDLVLAVIILEFMALSVWRRNSPGPLIDRFLAFAPGVCLLLALRAALTGSDWIWVAAFMAASFPVHVADLLRRRL